MRYITLSKSQRRNALGLPTLFCCFEKVYDSGPHGLLEGLVLATVPPAPEACDRHGVCDHRSDIRSCQQLCQSGQRSVVELSRLPQGCTLMPAPTPAIYGLH